MSPTLSLLLSALCSTVPVSEKTAFQTAAGWSPELDLRSDVAIVYGVNPSFRERLESWRSRGYGVHMMTGVAWGGYQDYLDGRFDGVDHWHEGQVARDGTMIMHGARVPYMVPTPSYVEYLKSLVKEAIDAGVTGIHLEEPEFWNRGGYSDGFRQEWQAFYGEPWQAQHESPEATYRSARLKYHLYFRALKEIFAFAKSYSEPTGNRVRCYVPTHTLINYAAWGIVSPESSLADLPGMDGYIAQVWTGTARTPTVYNGVEKERTFENAWIEYASMSAMTRPTGRKVFFLTDPIEDNPNYTWENYKKNYEDTFTAQLLHPTVGDYEVMPWPHRIFLGTYLVEGSKEKTRIPADYATEILTLINALNDVPAPDAQSEASANVGVLVSDTLMFQRFPTHGDDDRRLSNFYGLALPLVKHGVPVELVQMENLRQPDALRGIRVLLMTYANMKPLDPAYHAVIADWVRQGGALIYVGRDDDPYQTMREWWNQGEPRYDTPSAHLFAELGVDVPKAGGVSATPCGRGSVRVERRNPKELAASADGGDRVRGVVRDALASQGLRLVETNRFHVARGPYDIAAVMDESASDEPLVIPGPVIDLYDPSLPALSEKVVRAGERAFVFSVRRRVGSRAGVLAASSRAYDESDDGRCYTATFRGPAETQGVARVWVPGAPSSVAASSGDGSPVAVESDYDAASSTARLRYANSPDGVRIRVAF